jgi:hypothetical protein
LDHQSYFKVFVAGGWFTLAFMALVFAAVSKRHW